MIDIAVEIQLKSGTIWEFSDSWPSGSDKNHDNHAPITQKLYRLKITAPGTPIVTDCLYDFATFQIDMYGMGNVWQMYGTVKLGSSHLVTTLSPALPGTNLSGEYSKRTLVPFMRSSTSFLVRVDWC